MLVSQVRRTGIVRRGWHDTEWSKQWVQVLRGPRPPAAKWPRVQRQSPSNVPVPSRGGLPNTGVRPPTKVTDSGPRRNPEENCAAAQATVRRLEVALAGLEESYMAAREAIQASLVKARAAARVIPVSDRITECRSFIERAERRVTKAEEGNNFVEKQMKAEVVEGRARLRRLEQELELQVVPVPTTSEVLRLQAMVSQLQVEKEELLRNASGSMSERPAVRVEDIPIMPNFIPAELAQWMDDRRVELQEALSQGDDAAVLEITSKMAKGAERMVQMKRHVPDDELAMRSAQARVVSLHIDGRKGGGTPMWSPRMPRGRSIQPRSHRWRR